MTNNQIALIKEALLEEELAEMAVIDTLPDEEIAFTEKYKIKMQKLLSKHKKRTHNTDRFIPKRLVGVLVAILITLALMMSISAIRKPIVKFIVNVYDSFISISVEEDEGSTPPKTIKQIYMPSYKIDGFHIHSTNNQSTISITIWTNNNNVFISLEQSIISDEIFLDYETANFTKIKLNSYETYYIEKNNNYCFIWSDGEYIFKMIFPNIIEFSEIEKVIESMEAAEG